MLRMAGVKLHPGFRALIGATLLALGLVRHSGPGIVVIGAVLVAWGVIDAVQRR